MSGTLNTILLFWLHWFNNPQFLFFLWLFLKLDVAALWCFVKTHCSRFSRPVFDGLTLKNLTAATLNGEVKFPDSLSFSSNVKIKLEWRKRENWCFCKVRDGNLLMGSWWELEKFPPTDPVWYHTTEVVWEFGSHRRTACLARVKLSGGLLETWEVRESWNVDGD